MPKENTNQTCTKDELCALEKIAYDIREDCIKLLTTAEQGHSAGSMGMADVVTALYFKILNIDPKHPTNPQRDRLVLSNGHICPILYTALAHKGFFDKKELLTYGKLNSILQGHPHNLVTPGIENSSGPLGQGISQAIGMALACKMDQLTNTIYCLGSDGELDEGQTWEAAMCAPKYKLDNLVWIIDRNNIQIDGHTEEIMPLEPLRDKLEAFNWYVLEIDGHNISEIINACNFARTIVGRPTVIIAHTIPGKGVDFMEYKFEWHAKAPNKKEATIALKKLRSLEGKIECYDL